MMINFWFAMDIVTLQIFRYMQRALVALCTVEHEDKNNSLYYYLGICW